jgi:26S proteasome regulatory subunit N7
MGPYYKSVTSASNILPLDKSLLAEMEAANEEELKKLDERLAEAEKIEGESEISDALKARANYLTRIGDKVRFLFLHHFPRLHEMNLGTIPTSPKARTRKDTRARVAHRHHTDHRPSRVLLLRHRDRDSLHGQGREVRRLPVPTAFLANLPLHRLIDEGGDWDRRNRLKVYTGLHFLSIRQFKRGGELLLDALSTFTATELLSYNEFVGLTVIANTLGLKRVDLKKKVRTFSIFCPVYPSLTRTFAAHQRPRSESGSPRNTSTRRPSQKLIRVPL